MKPRVTSLSIAAGLAAHALFACSADDAALGKLDATSIAPSDSFQAYSLARVKDGDGEIEDLVVSDDYVFFIAFWQGIYRMPKYGGDVELIEQSRKANIIALAANHEQVFWQRFAGSDEQSHFDLHLQAIAGGAQRDLSSVRSLSFGRNYSNTLRADAEHVFMISQDSVIALPIDGGAPEQFATPELTPDDEVPSSPIWVLDYPALFMTRCANSEVDCPLLRTDFTTGVTASVGPIPAGSAALAVDEAFVYVTDNKRMWRLAKSDFSRTQVYESDDQDESLSREMLVDAENVYFMSYGSSGPQLRAVPKAGGVARLIGGGPQLAGGSWKLAQDDAFVFILSGPIRQTDGNWGGNEILAFPKAPVGVTRARAGHTTE
jgi:hypothetical protein